VHGGPDKAIYAYPAERYAYWHRELPGMALPWGIFGENLTTEGLNEDDLKIGDRFLIGSTEVAVTQPRLPCFKLGLRLGRDDISAPSVSIHSGKKRAYQVKKKPR